MKRQHKKALKISGIVAAFLGVIAILCIVFAPKSDLKEINPLFTRGELNQVGQWVESNDSIYTEKMFECQGLEIELAFEHNVNYEVYYYDKDGNFMEKTGVLSEDYVNEDLNRVFARIVITPNWSKIDTNTQEVKWYEVSKYANQLTIQVNKEQKELKSFVVDLMDEDIVVKYLDGMTWDDYLNSTLNTRFNKSDDNICVSSAVLYHQIDDNRQIEVSTTDVISELYKYSFE